MKLKVGPNIEQNKVRLDFKSDPAKPDNTPSYKIEKSLADEFVGKYNKQEDSIKKFTLVSVFSGMILSWLIARKGTPHSSNNKICKIIGIPAGGIAGAIASSVISCKMKEKLMSEYNVTGYNESE